MVTRTLAGSINLGTGTVELGQGVLLVTNCDPEIFAQPIPIQVNGEYFLGGIEFSGINITECQNREFIIKAYDETSTLNFFSYGGIPISSIIVRQAGSGFEAVTTRVGLTSSSGSGANSWFSVEFQETPTVTSQSLDSLTLESQKSTVGQ